MAIFKQDKIDKIGKIINRETWMSEENLSPREGAIALHKPAELPGGGFILYITDSELIALAKAIQKVYPEDFR